MITRKKLLAAAVSAMAALWMLPSAAQDYPSRPIRIVVPQPPGGPTDVGARLFAEKLRGVLGQAVVVENKPGAATQIAISYVVKAPADGYTLLYGGNSLGSLPFTSKSYDVDWTKDLTPISVLVGLPVGIAVTSQLPARNLEEMLADIKGNPNKRFFASMGPSDYISIQMFQEAGSLPFDIVRYNGAAPGIRALMGGDVQFVYTTLGTLKPLQDQGKLRVVTVWGDKRSALMPDVPPITEHPAFRNVPMTPSWHGIVGPGKMPPEVVKTLADAIAKIARDPDYVKRMAEQGMEVVGSTPQEAVQRVRADIASWQRIAKQLDLKPQ